MANTNGYQTVYLDSSRTFLSPNLQRLQDGQVAHILLDALNQMSPMEQDAFANLSLQMMGGEDFFGNLGRGISQFASKAMPYIAPVAQIAAPLVGTAIGGPVGGAIGGQLAGMLSKVATPSPPPTRTPPRLASPPARPSSLQPAAAPMPTAGANLNPAATQLMTLLSNPQLIQALLGQVLGSAGNTNTAVQTGGGTQNIPFGALMNTVSTLAQRAAEEAIYTGTPESENYLLDNVGTYLIDDPSNPSQRADAVMQLLTEDYEWQHQYADQEYEQLESADPVAEWLVNAGLVSY